MPEDAGRPARARSVWSGTISFGLVSIPVSLFPATRSSRVSLRMLSPGGTPLSRRYFDPETGEEIPRDGIVRGYEIEKDRYVRVSEEELESVQPEKTRDIDLRRFVPADDLDPVYFERAYFLTPDGDSTKAYRLLAAVMEQTGRAGIASFVMRAREYLIAILAENGILRAETLRFHDEIRPVSAIDLPDRPSIPDGRVAAMREAIRAGTEEELDPAELENAYADRLLGLVESKRESDRDVVAAGTPSEDAEADVIDLMEVLKKSLRGDAAGAYTPRRAAGARGRGASGQADELEDLTKAELYERAQELDVAGRSSMTKAELADAIRRSA